MKSLKSEIKPSKRIALSVEVGFRRTYGRQNESGKLINISLSGAFLKTDSPDFNLNDKVHLQFKVGSRKRSLIAKIVWKNEYGAGLEFFHSNNRDIQIIDDLMYFVESSRQDRKSVLEDIFSKVA